MKEIKELAATWIKWFETISSEAWDETRIIICQWSEVFSLATISLITSLIHKHVHLNYEFLWTVALTLFTLLNIWDYENYEEVVEIQKFLN